MPSTKRLINLLLPLTDACANCYTRFCIYFPVAHYSKGVCSVAATYKPHHACGFATKTIPQGAPLPTEHSKITILHGIGPRSLNLSISYYQLLLCFLGVWVWLVEWLGRSNRSANFAACYRISPAVTNSCPNFWAGTIYFPVAHQARRM